MKLLFETSKLCRSNKPKSDRYWIKYVTVVRDVAHAKHRDIVNTNLAI